MKSRVFLPALLAVGLIYLVSATDARAGACGYEPACGAPVTCCEPAPSCGCRRPCLLDRLRDHLNRLKCCRPSCCEPVCCDPEPACGCAAEPACGCDAEPDCGCGHSRRRCGGLLQHLRHKLNRSRCCDSCEPACGSPEPYCGCGYK
jgi:hypothetical protein